MTGEIDALYIYDEHNSPLVEHVYRSRPPSAAAVLPLYLAHPAPRPSVLYIPNTTPPVTVFSIVQSNLLFLALSEVDTEPLLVLEFLHRLVDILEDFVGAPLISSKIQANYDVVAQLLHEMCDAGIVCNTEPNALQEVVEMPGWMGKLLGGVGLPGSSTPILGPPNPLKQSLSAANVAQGPAIPWRKAGVRHTSNELYVDIIESLSVIIAPSGRLLSALVSGTIAFTAKISGVPDLILNLTTPGGPQAIGRKLDLPVFHPCVRLARWRERPGELSFVPPDGRFILAGYEVDLLSVDPSLDEPPTHMEKVFLPAFVDMRKSLGPTGSDFEVRLTLNTSFPGYSSTSRPGMGRGGSGTSTPSFLGGSGSPSSPVLDEVVVTIPIPKSVRSITDMQASRGEAMFTPGSDTLEWRVPTKEAGTVSGTATLRCTVLGHQTAEDDYDDDAEGADADADANLLRGYYDADAATSYQTADAETGAVGTRKRKTKKKKKTTKTKKSSKSATTNPLVASDMDSLPQSSSPDPSKPQSPAPQPPSASSPAPPAPSPSSIFYTPPRKTKAQINASLMPNSASVSFSVRGWLPSGVKVDSLNVDPRRSRGLGEGVKPYKGVKYLCISKKGVETRC
ncbi:putative AP-3 adaptor complex subunit mu [Aspergillus clavatus NRRL 1]|uniref:AP-3 adaptor complex subunit mu, putative n=1 Tax=Aspergillus clavatus (strain ATCC 1007 / CBS 513.65 / DSM 816 / NCTC 3887 / NRRL 1 / QM 1276 / 107) TaxID=344612 RepID=A1CIR8_ASPCL|nr:AP-3 adaptor complex subunit mu, putative [Aspergillus clavatus NRRL 1]EAW10773.1 AP-3 adaptor complex subunit mu, putative [Aspergillus clavatus NRRL 1]